jgi:hypothetical protein
MDHMDFPDLAAPGLEAYAYENAARFGLPIPEVDFQGVLENLAVLQTHAAILRAALKAAGAPNIGPEAS